MMRMQAERMQQLHDDHINDASSWGEALLLCFGSTPDAPSAQALWGSESVHTGTRQSLGLSADWVTSLGSMRPASGRRQRRPSLAHRQRPPSTTADRSPFRPLAHLLGAGGGTPVAPQLDALRQGVVIQKQRRDRRGLTISPASAGKHCRTGAPNPRTKKHSNRVANDQPHRRAQSSGPAHDGRRRPPHLATDSPQHGPDGWRPTLSLNDLRSGEWRAVTPNEQDRLMALLSGRQHRSRSRP